MDGQTIVHICLETRLNDQNSLAFDDQSIITVPVPEKSGHFLPIKKSHFSPEKV